MSNKIRIYVHTFLLCSMQLGLCMDNPNDKKPEIPQIPVSKPLTSSGSVSNSSSGLYSSGSSYSWSFNPVSFVAGLVSSAATTVHNKFSDEAALEKIGYPVINSYAQSELIKCVEMYNTILEPKNKNNIKENLERVQRRTEYLTRIFCMLPDRADFGEIILHCNQNHQRAMSVFLHDWYNKFLQEKVTVCNQLNEEIKQLNTSKDYKSQPNMPSLSAQTDALSLQLTIPTLSGAKQYFWDSANSLYSTARDQLSDTAAFQKLGWPINDVFAQQELNHTEQQYEKVMKANTREDRAALLFFVLRRTEYLVRAYLALCNQGSNDISFAQHMIKNHQKAMFPLLLKLFTNFTTHKRQDLQLKQQVLLKKSDHHDEIINNKIGFEFGKVTNKNAEEIKKLLPLSCFLLKQEHGTSGFVVTQETSTIEILSRVGDFLVTGVPGIKLGVLTADCLPIIFKDSKNKAVGIAHAGWRGSVGNISKAVLECMKRNYDTKPDDLSIIFGPCIHNCCYKVKDDLITRVKEYTFGEKTIITRGNDNFFDLLAFNKALLVFLGIKETAIDSSTSKCTSCNAQYHSHRREGEQAGRQLSTVWIDE